jgi:hypothetical protein
MIPLVLPTGKLTLTSLKKQFRKKFFALLMYSVREEDFMITALFAVY